MPKENPSLIEDIEPERYRAPALDKGLDILELLAEQAGALTQAEIAKAMGRSQSEIYRMLERLTARGYIIRPNNGDRYLLSMKLFILANHYPPVRRLMAQAQPLMDNFAREAKQSCHLVMPENGVTIVMVQASPADSWEFRVRVGARLSLLETGSGKTLLAFQNEAHLSDTLITWGATHLLAKVSELLPELQHIRQQGFRDHESRQLVGVRDLSVPILAANGNALAVITCPYIGRLPLDQHENKEQILTRLQDLAQKLAID